MITWLSIYVKEPLSHKLKASVLRAPYCMNAVPQEIKKKKVTCKSLYTIFEKTRRQDADSDTLKKWPVTKMLPSNLCSH